MRAHRRIDEEAQLARAWVHQLGPAWVARFDQMHADLRQMATEANVDPDSEAFGATWCLATTFLHRIAALLAEDQPDQGETLGDAASILASVALWGRAVRAAPLP
jgi:hypothetical protein